MDLYEHQGKELLARFSIPTGTGSVAYTPEETEAAARELLPADGGVVVVKAQVLAGGRGKAGGVRVARSAAEAREAAEAILGLEIKGHVTRRLYVERGIEIAHEYYFSITFDRGAKAPLFLLSTMGGMDIEAVAVEHPEALARLHLDSELGLHPFFLRRLLYSAGVPAGEHKAVGAVIKAVYRAYVESDAMLVEINPLVITAAGDAVAADAKVTIDGNALGRHPEIAELRDAAAADPQEQKAHELGVTYVKLDGEVGILGNGAGLVMSTLDVVAQCGGRPANFLDVGGGAQAEAIVDALDVILSDTKVRSILFNIFGGITRCDEVANGLLQALERMTNSIPIVVRLDGTNDVEGRRILAEAAPANVHVEKTMLEAAAKAVERAGGTA